MEPRQIIINAGLRVAEVARICKVTRGTIYNRLNGVQPKTAFMGQIADEMLRLIAVATASGELPPPDELKGKERYSYIQKTLSHARHVG